LPGSSNSETRRSSVARLEMPHGSLPIADRIRYTIGRAQPASDTEYLIAVIGFTIAMEDQLHYLRET
jgi:hypothetical protein